MNREDGSIKRKNGDIPQEAWRNSQRQIKR